MTGNIGNLVFGASSEVRFFLFFAVSRVPEAIVIGYLIFAMIIDNELVDYWPRLPYIFMQK